jgi:hypothetical protein
MYVLNETNVAVEKQYVLHISVCGCACTRVALLIQHATRRHIAICSFSSSTTFFRYYLINGTIFEKKKY